MNDFEPDIQAYVGFDFHDNSLLLVNDYGLFRRIELNLQGGHCNIITETSELLDLKIWFEFLFFFICVKKQNK